MKDALSNTIKSDLRLPENIEPWENYDCGLAILHFSDSEGYEGVMLYGERKEIYEKLLHLQRIKNNIESVFDFCRNVDDKKISIEDSAALHAIAKILHHVISDEKLEFRDDFL